MRKRLNPRLQIDLLFRKYGMGSFSEAERRQIVAVLLAILEEREVLPTRDWVLLCRSIRRTLKEKKKRIRG